jgi:hypothetical protein
VTSDVIAAREIVVEVWLDSGLCPDRHAENIKAVREGRHDNNNTVKMALAGIAFGRRARARREQQIADAVAGRHA